jgi:hypothetical protein
MPVYQVFGRCGPQVVGDDFAALNPNMCHMTAVVLLHTLKLSWLVMMTKGPYAITRMDSKHLKPNHCNVDVAHLVP